MKKSSKISLTLASMASILVATACGTSGPQMSVRCYQDPRNPNVCEPIMHTGYVPIYYPMFYNGYYYGPMGYRTSAPLVGSSDYTAARARASGTSFGSNGAASRGSVTRGGFGSTAAGRASGSAS